MFTPYAVVRKSEDPGRYLDALERPMHGVNQSGLTLLVSDQIDPKLDAEAFMDAVAEIHECEPCVPVRLGDPLESEAAGARFLEAGAERFLKLLDRLDGAEEWSVHVAPLGGSVSECAESPEQEQRRGRGYLEARRTEMDLASGMDASVSRVIAELAQCLGADARDTRTVVADQGAGSLVLLVDRGCSLVPAFREAAADARLPCTLTGPWPPFSFVSLAT